MCVTHSGHSFENVESPIAWRPSLGNFYELFEVMDLHLQASLITDVMLMDSSLIHAYCRASDLMMFDTYLEVASAYIHTYVLDCGQAQMCSIQAHSQILCQLADDGRMSTSLTHLDEQSCHKAVRVS